MRAREDTYERVTADAAVAQISGWLEAGDRRRVAELAGSPGSGRTQVLLRVGEALAERAVVVDATGLTAEEVLERVMTAAEAEPSPGWRGGWGRALRDTELGDGAVIIVNAQRAGRTRRSAQPRRVVRDLAQSLAVAACTKVLVEADLDDRRWPGGRLALRLEAGDGGTPAAPEPESVAEAAVATEPVVVALALAELRRVPIAVWLEAANVLGARLPGEDALLAAARNLPEGAGIWIADGFAGFADERSAERIRSVCEEAQSRAFSSHLVDWLLSRCADLRHEQGWECAGPVGWYAAHALAMHAVQAGRFGEVQRDGGTVANLDQVSLLDAANCDASGGPIDHRSPAGDAAALWMSGVDSLPQGDWASWLHLMSRVRGDEDLTAGIARSGIRLPWRVRWSHWRPPGSWGVDQVHPGPLRSVAEIDWPDRRAVAGRGAGDGRVWVWDAGSGEPLAGPWSAGLPQPGQAEPYWPSTYDPDRTPAWAEMSSYGTDPGLFSEGRWIGDTYIVCGPGGLFAVDAVDESAVGNLVELPGEPFFAGFGRVSGGLPELESPDRAALEALLQPAALRRLSADALPAALEHPAARLLLTDIGFPAFCAAGMRLDAVGAVDHMDRAGHTGLVELTAEEVWASTEEDDVPESASSGTYFLLGRWAGDAVVLDGTAGGVYLVPSPEGENCPYEQPLLAGDLMRFVAMLQVYLLGRALLPMATSAVERKRIRESIEHGLEWVDEEGAECEAWWEDLGGVD